MKNLSPIMFVGTGSDVGKSLIATGICRILKQDGYVPAPFKAQNMSLNSFATPDGFEIGRAQAVQAEACGIAPHTDMNPILLKPTSQKSSQLVLHGKPVGDQSAKEYFNGSRRTNLFIEVQQAFNRLKEKYSPIVLEGAGSISELNLKNRDIVNMTMAKFAQANVYLIADIDRGGVFGSVYGTIELLEPWERELVKGIIINKFRGDASLFEEGKKKLEQITGLPVVGIIPYNTDIYIEEEDSVSIKQKNITAKSDTINVGVILLPHLSNFTDFNLLERDDRAHLFYSKEKGELEKADILILPGSKNTIYDLQFLRKTGIAKTILNAVENGKKVIGICGGYQMMGELIKDPNEVESNINQIPGLGIFPLETVLTINKTTEQRVFFYKNHPEPCNGYEIHMGETTTHLPSPLVSYNETSEGYIRGNCWGTYMHGILDNQVVIDDLLEGISQENKPSYKDFKEAEYDKLADHLRSHLDMGQIYRDLNQLSEV